MKLLNKFNILPMVYTYQIMECDNNFNIKTKCKLYNKWLWTPDFEKQTIHSFFRFNNTIYYQN